MPPCAFSESQHTALRQPGANHTISSITQGLMGQGDGMQSPTGLRIPSPLRALSQTVFDNHGGQPSWEATPASLCLRVTLHAPPISQHCNCHTVARQHADHSLCSCHTEAQCVYECWPLTMQLHEFCLECLQQILAPCICYFVLQCLKLDDTLLLLVDVELVEVVNVLQRSSP
jgi:hypothetical protein